MKNHSSTLSASTYLKFEFRLPDHMDVSSKSFGVLEAVGRRPRLDGGEALPIPRRDGSRVPYGLVLSEAAPRSETYADPEAPPVIPNERLMRDEWTSDLDVILMDLGIGYVRGTKARGFARQARVKVATLMDEAGYIRAIKVSVLPPGLPSLVLADFIEEPPASRSGRWTSPWPSSRGPRGGADAAAAFTRTASRSAATSAVRPTVPFTRPR